MAALSVVDHKKLVKYPPPTLEPANMSIKVAFKLVIDNVELVNKMLKLIRSFVAVEFK
jgi:hypothetical protein